MTFLSDEVLPTDRSLISFSCDIWTDRLDRSYLGVTASWIDISHNRFQPRDAVVAFVKVRSHTGEELAAHVSGVLALLGGEDAVSYGHSITTDNATSNDSLKNLADIDHLPCVAHSLHLAIRDAMDIEPFKSDLRVVRSVVRWWRARFSTIQRAVVDDNDHLILGPLKDDKQGRFPLPPLPPREVRTRWSSTLFLLAYLQRLDVRKWFDYIQTHPHDVGLSKSSTKGWKGDSARIDKKDLEEVDEEDFSTVPNLPPEFDWLGPGFNTMIDLFQLLEPLGRITKLVQSASTPTLAPAWLNLVMRLRKWNVLKDIDAPHRVSGRRTLLPEPTSSRKSKRDDNKESTLMPNGNLPEAANLDFRTRAAWDKWAELTNIPKNAKRRSRTPRHLVEGFVIDAGDGGYKDAAEDESIDDGCESAPTGVESATEVLGLTGDDLDDGDVKASDAARPVRSAPQSDPAPSQPDSNHMADPKHDNDARRLVAMRLGDHLLEWVHLKTPAVAMAVFLYPHALSWVRGVLDAKDDRVSEDMRDAWRLGLAKAQDMARDWFSKQAVAPATSTPAPSRVYTVVSDDEDENTDAFDTTRARGSIGSSDPVDVYLGGLSTSCDLPLVEYWKQAPRDLRPLAAKAHGALASSSASERLFSVSGYIGRARRLRLTCANLSTLSVLKANEMWLEEWREVERRRRGPTRTRLML